MSVVEVVEGRGKLGLHECNVSNVSNVSNVKNMSVMLVT